jgi:peptidoglycan lytic transglycosylase
LCGIRALGGMSTAARALRRLAAHLVLAAAALASTSSAAPALGPEDRLAVAQAFREAERGEWQRAWRLLGQVPDPLPAKTLRWLRMFEGGQASDFATMASFLMANPHWPNPDQLQVLAEEAIRDPADHELIRAFFAERAPLTTRGRIRYAQALFQIGAEDEAVALIRKAWIEGDFSAREDKRFVAQYGRHLRQEDHVARLDSLLWDLRRSAAKRMLNRVPQGHRRLAEARIALQGRSGSVDRAIEAVPAALQDDPGLLYDRLRWRRQHHLYDGVQAILLDPPAELDRPDRWWFERLLEIRRLLRRGDFARAWRLAANHGQTEGEDFAEATWLAGWLALRHGQDPSEAFRRFIVMHEAVTAPTERSRAAYWAGRSAAALGDQALARYWYQAAARHRIAYYGQLAALELGEPAPTEPVPPPDLGELTAFEASEIARVVRMLIEVGADDQLRPFAIHLIGQAASPSEVGMAAELIAQSGRVDLVTQGSRAAAYRGQVNEAAAFPIPDLASLVDGPEGQPETALLLGVARQESTFNTWGMSHAGARGLLQLMPQTAKLMARALRVPYDSARLTADPDYNVRLGRHYLRTLLERYDGEAVLAMAAYNAGPRRVQDWLELNGDPRRGTLHDLVDWVELIPFDETRAYVQRVIEARNMYRQRLADGEVARIHFPPATGPLRPIPTPILKPLEAAPAAAQAAPGQGGDQIAPPGQTSAALARIPEARPASASLDAGEAEVALIAVWPELKPDGLVAIKQAAAPPQPELKPAAP